MILRDYQQLAYDATHEAFRSHSRVLDVLATGLGKTVLFSSLARDWEDGRVLVVAPMIELIGQAAKKIRQVTGTMPDIEQAENYAHESSWARNQFVVASKQTLCGKRQRYQRLSQIGLVILDEADNMLTKPVAAMVDWFVEKGAKILGVTATPERSDKRAMRNMFETCAFDMGIHDAVKGGWLVAPKAHSIQLQSLDLSLVGTKGGQGDFKDGELAKVMEDDKVCCEIAEITANESGNLKTVVYCAGVHEARKVANRLVDSYGLKADWVCADQKLCDKRRRREVLRSFAEDPDGVQIVANVGILTRGWDFPGLQHIVMGRPTKSLNLFTQILGRGARPLEGTVDFEGSTPETRIAAIAASGKPHFKVTDLRDNTLQHKLISTADVLGGKLGYEALQLAKRKLAEAGRAVDVNEALEEAEAEIERRERERLAKLAAKAKYKHVEADLFDPYQRANVARAEQRTVRMLFGKHKGKPLHELPGGYLKWLSGGDCKLPKWFEGAVRAEVTRRHGGTVKQQQSSFWDTFNKLSQTAAG